MGRTKSRKLPVDVLKIIACFCVLLLHTCPPENHWFAQQPLYLLGVFGIPLFFMVNGYLLYSKELNCKYMSKKIVHNVRLVLCWSIPLTMLVSIKNFRGGVELIYGIVQGRGLLFHFWFLFALVIIHAIVFLLNLICQKFRKKAIQEVLSGKTLAFTIASIFAVHVVNVLIYNNYSLTIREIVIPPLRVITNLGYFFLGMHLAKHRFKKDGLMSAVLIFVFFLSAISVILLDNYVYSFTWASNYYNTLVVITGSISLFVALLKLNLKREKTIEMFVQFTMPIYILHPFLIKVIGGIFRVNGMYYSALCFLAVIIGVPIITLIFRKVRLSFLID